MPEYGRNIQNMVDHILTIADREERNKAAQSVITIMGNMYPYLRDINDYKHKLWDHLAIMSDFKLDIDSPYETPKPEAFQEQPQKVPYNSHRLRYRHYGIAIEQLVAKAAEMEEGEEKQALIKLLANHMKKSYLTWNKDAVDDEKIYDDISTLSGGKIQCNDIKLTETKEIINNQRRKRSNPSRNTGHNSNNNRNQKRRRAN